MMHCMKFMGYFSCSLALSPYMLHIIAIHTLMKQEFLLVNNYIYIFLNVNYMTNTTLL